MSRSKKINNRQEGKVAIILPGVTRWMRKPGHRHGVAGAVWTWSVAASLSCWRGRRNGSGSESGKAGVGADSLAGRISAWWRRCSRIRRRWVRSLRLCFHSAFELERLTLEPQVLRPGRTDEENEVPAEGEALATWPLLAGGDAGVPSPQKVMRRLTLSS